MCCKLAQEEGLQSFIAYLKDLVQKRADEDYTALVEGESLPFAFAQS